MSAYVSPPFFPVYDAKTASQYAAVFSFCAVRLPKELGQLLSNLLEVLIPASENNF